MRLNSHTSALFSSHFALGLRDRQRSGSKSFQCHGRFWRFGEIFVRLNKTS